jgi:PhnB protein
MTAPINAGARLNPYIGFKGHARDAMEFYQSVFGGDLRVSTFGEFGAPEGVDANQVMHAQLETPQGFTLMASDTPAQMPYNPGETMSVSLSGEDGDALHGWWEKLSNGGQVTMPLEKQMWGDEFGMCTDRFGIAWMVNITQPK